MDERTCVTIAGEQLVLHAARALHWPAGNGLMIADRHLGKGDTFRRVGIALPSGGTDAVMARLDRLLEVTCAAQLIVLGDFLHGAAPGFGVSERWETFRRRHSAVEFRVVAGNHDRALRASRLSLDAVDESVLLGPFELVHVPDENSVTVQLCGHIHPALSVVGLPGRWPAFWHRRRYTVLPAFSQFTGGHAIRLATGEAATACINGHLLTVEGPSA